MISRKQLGETVLISKDFKDFYNRFLVNNSLHDQDSLKQCLKLFYYKFMKYWKNCHRNKSKFERKYSKWLEEIVHFPENYEAVPEPTPENKTPRKRGRPSKLFSEASERTKRRIIQHKVDSISTPEAVRVLSTRLRKKGNKAGSSSLNLIASSTPTSSTKILHKIRNIEKPCIPYTPEEALSLLIEAKLSKSSYNLIRKSSKERNVNIYPSYHKLRAAKMLCYPENIRCTESSCEVSLQDLMNHTSQRILESIIAPSDGDYSLVCKWGFDGSSGQSQYKQAWKDKDVSDESIFITSIVPLVLTGKEGVIWKNLRPSSTRFCRPVRLQFVKERKNIIKEEEKYIKKQIDELKPFKNGGLQINFNLLLTMVNGKAISALTDTSTLQCPICKQTAKGTSWTVTDPVHGKSFEYGLSPLHAYIRFMEFVLAISYRLGLKAKIRGDKNDPEIKMRKEVVLQKLKETMHICPDLPKQGFGSTSDGNCARKFFSNPLAASKATEIDQELIKRFGVILFVLSSGHEANIENFESYCNQTLLHYENLYSWHQLTPTVHKILAHSAEVMKNSILPMGQLSEEAQEARNKDLRNYREFFCRKSSRRVNINDLFCRLLLTSDPLISSVRKLPKKSVRKLEPEIRKDTKELLIFSESEGCSGDSSDESSEEISYGESSSSSDA